MHHAISITDDKLSTEKGSDEDLAILGTVSGDANFVLLQGVIQSLQGLELRICCIDNFATEIHHDSLEPMLVESLGPNYHEKLKFSIYIKEIRGDSSKFFQFNRSFTASIFSSASIVQEYATVTLNKTIFLFKKGYNSIASNFLSFSNK